MGTSVCPWKRHGSAGFESIAHQHKLKGWTMVTNKPEGVTRWAQQDCSRWLYACIINGWKKEQFDRLEEFWWEYHDKDGKPIIFGKGSGARISIATKRNDMKSV